MTQHTISIMDMEIKNSKRKKKIVGDFEVKWWNVKSKNAIELAKKIKVEGNWI